MSPAEKYGRIQDLPSAALAQVRDAGQVLASKGVAHDAGAAQSPAVKYGAPVNNQLQRSLSQGRSL